MHAPTPVRAAVRGTKTQSLEAQNNQRRMAAMVARLEHERVLTSLGLRNKVTSRRDIRQMRKDHERQVQRLLNPSRSAPSLPRDARAPPRRDTRKIQTVPWVPFDNRPAPPPPVCPPPNEYSFTSAVNRQLAQINGPGDPLGLRLPYMAGWAYLTPSKQRELQQLAMASVPTCKPRLPEERRAHDEAVADAAREQTEEMEVSWVKRLNARRAADMNSKARERVGAAVASPSGHRSPPALSPAEIVSETQRGRWTIPGETPSSRWQHAAASLKQAAAR